MMEKKLFCLISLLVVCSITFFMPEARAALWQVPGDFATIQEAINSSTVAEGDRVVVGPGSHAGAIVTKMVEIKGEDGAVINDGPLPWSSRTFKAGFLFPGGLGSGTTISHLKFELVEFPVFSRGADDVTVEHCMLSDPIQGITNWKGSGWYISHNVIIDLRTANGGGIGIICADYAAIAGGIRDNVISHNKITGTLHVAANDGGGYNGSGIVLYADFRWGRAGAEKIVNNRVVKNNVSMNSDTPGVVDIVAIELTEAQSPLSNYVIYDNAIGFNDLRGTVLQLDLMPAALGDVNKISKNLGDNRGHGLHPSVFGPGGN
jgi:hypothetical protein